MSLLPQHTELASVARQLKAGLNRSGLAAVLRSGTGLAPAVASRGNARGKAQALDAVGLGGRVGLLALLATAQQLRDILLVQLGARQRP